MSHDNHRKMQALDTELSLQAKSLEDLRQGMREAGQWHEEIVQARGAKVQLACKAGCSHCCSLPVAASLPELAHLSAFINETFSAEDSSALRSRLSEEAGDGAARAGDSQASRVCALLVDGLCSAHGARPMACRGWNSLDAAPCLVASREPAAPPSIPVDSRVRGTATAIAEGMREGARRLDLDDSVLDLRSAMRVLLTEYEDWTRRWFAGEPLPETFHGSPELPVHLGTDGRWRTRTVED